MVLTGGTSMNTSTFENLESIDLGKLKELKGKNLKNPFLCYLNINSLRNKIVDLRYVLAQTGQSAKQNLVKIPRCSVLCGRLQLPSLP